MVVNNRVAVGEAVAPGPRMGRRWRAPLRAVLRRMPLLSLLVTQLLGGEAAARYQPGLPRRASLVTVAGDDPRLWGFVDSIAGRVGSAPLDEPREAALQTNPENEVLNGCGRLETQLTTALRRGLREDRPR